MSIDFARWVQRRLSAHGIPCADDGVLGTLTRGCLVAFQRKKNLRPTATTTAETVAALRLDPNGSDAGPAMVGVLPPWLAEMRRRQGLHEVRDHGILSRWLKSDGKTLGDPAKLPWCGDAVETAIGRTLPDEPLPKNPYFARCWLSFGRKTRPRLGAVLVFWRGSPKALSGHVGFYVGEDADSYQVLGGNQGNAVTQARIARDRLLGARWPLTYDLDTLAINRAANGRLSTNEA